MMRPCSRDEELVQTGQTGRKTYRMELRRAGVAVLTGALLLSGTPICAIAEGAPAASSQSAPAAPPDGQAGGSSMGGAPGAGGGGADTMTYDYSGTLSGALTANGEEASSSDSISSTTSAENAALVEAGGALALDGATLTKSGDDTDGDACNFYGVNSILLAVGSGSTATVQNSSLSATSEGSNGIFATDGAQVLAKDTTISTTAGNSRGLDATYGGSILAGGMTIETKGDHCAALATDRGGGTISVTDSSLQTAGSGSPLLYSTGDIEVSGVSGTSTGSQIAGMEGLNTILINNSSLTSTNTDKTASDPVADAVIIYQSTSGDAESTTGESATFQAANSTLSSSITSGSFFYLTNISADIVLSHTTLDFDSDNADLLMAAGNDSNNWGSAGSNGATVKLTCIGEDLSGTISADTISQASVYLTDGSTWSGTTEIAENADATQTTESPLSVAVDNTSTWTVTGGCTLSNLTVAEGGKVQDQDGKDVKIVDASGNVLRDGDSDVTVTVEGTYSTDYDSSEEGTLAQTADRSAYDEAFGTQTSFEMGDGSSSSAASTDEAGTQEAAASSESGSQESTSWWDQIVAFFKGLFG